MVVLPAESDVLARHPVKSPRHIPSLVWIAGILRKVRRSGRSSGTIDRREQDQVAPRIVNLSASDGEAVLVVVEPQTVVNHVAEETLLRTLRGIPGAADSAAVFTSHITSQRKCSLADNSFRVVVVFDLNTVVRVIAHAARRVQRVLTQHVLIAQNGQPSVWPPKNLKSQTRPVVETPVRLPAV